MTEDADAHRIGERADLLPEEQQAGSDDPLAQAEEILRESDERTTGADEDADSPEPLG